MNEERPYKYPQYYSVKERMEIIAMLQRNDLNLYQIGQMFGVSAATIRYHIRRYEEGTWKPSKKKKKLTKLQKLAAWLDNKLNEC